MDAKCQGKLQALLSGVDIIREPTDINKINDDMTSFLHMLREYMKDTHKLREQLTISKTAVERLEADLTQAKSDLDAERSHVMLLQKEADRLKDVESLMSGVNSSLAQAKLQIDSYKADFEQMEENVSQRDNKIKHLNSKLADKDCSISELHSTVKLNQENVSSLEDELKLERQTTSDLNRRSDELKAAHLEQMEALKLEMGEKVMKAQSRIAGYTAGCAPGSALNESSAIDYREIFKKKVAHVEAKHLKEVNDLKKTISRLQQRGERDRFDIA